MNKLILNKESKNGGPGSAQAPSGIDSVPLGLSHLPAGRDSAGVPPSQPVPRL